MSENAPLSWHETNQQALTRHLHRVRAALERHIQKQSAAPLSASPEENRRKESVQEDVWEVGVAPDALHTLAAVFQLSPFERDLLLLCAGIELDAAFSGLCAAAQGADGLRPYPTFSLALATLPEAHWSALSPRAPLRRHRLIEIGAGPSLTTSLLRIDERILHSLVGIDCPDERLRGLVDPVVGDGLLVPSHQAHAERVAAVWRQSGAALSPVIQLCGPERSTIRQIALEACRRVGFRLGRLAAESLPAGPAELEGFLETWDREAALTRSALVIESEGSEAGDGGRAAGLARIIERLSGLVLLSAPVRQPVRQRPMVFLEVGNPTLLEQRTLWNAALGPAAAALEGRIEQLSVQFDLSAVTLRAVSVEALGSVAGTADKECNKDYDNKDYDNKDCDGALGRALWESCRVSARPRLDDLAQRIEPSAGWGSLVLPEIQQAVLHDIAAHVRQRGTVYHRWGFAAPGTRGLGLSALFAGASGTGKTLAAEVLASELGLDLYRIDLSAVVSKYIGESEKNLRRVFDAAEAGGAILLFDEADALFGKRTEVKESHDRYANQEVAYLLQRMETYRGLAILTTNLRSSVDAAFLRRLRYVVAFPFPNLAQRAAIWQRVFPAAAPTEGLDPAKLARLTIAGGSIRNIALNAAFLAADAGEPIRMRHVLRASQAEYAKLEKTLTDSEVAEWL